MARRFYEITFTPGVQAAQAHYLGAPLDPTRGGGADSRCELTERETGFIARRDSFYLATVNQDGWPYVQHRGGATGFLKVLDARTLGFADFQGNRQYLTTGNLAGNDRVSLFLMDYPQRRRLKLLGHCQVIDAEGADRALLALLAGAATVPVERLMLIRLVAYDWNCSQHITPRLTEAEWQARQIFPNNE